MPEDSPIAKPSHQYLAVYQLDGDPADAMQQYLERVGSGKMVLSDSLDLANVSMHHWVPCGASQQARPALTGGAS